MFVAGAMALLVSSAAPLSTAQAQAPGGRNGGAWNRYRARRGRSVRIRRLLARRRIFDSETVEEPACTLRPKGDVTVQQAEKCKLQGLEDDVKCLEEGLTGVKAQG
jgi:hypothetical protein